ncbi:MAG: NAD(P)H-dependent oxidoreductase [Bacilli bacterium]|nr:NAD(P)H-dependent oxidoreductase [Bacilli bacterium]
MAKNILIAYFSHGGENLVDDQIVDLGENGNTKIAAKLLQEALKEKGFNANLFEIEPLIPYDRSYEGTLARSRQEYQDGAAPLINDGPNGYQAYDIVFLGYPNWWGTLPGPIVSFLRDHDLKGKTLIPFVTHGGQRFLYSLETIQKEAPQAPLLEGFAIAAPYMSSAKIVIDEWLKENLEKLA